MKIKVERVRKHSRKGQSLRGLLVLCVVYLSFSPCSAAHLAETEEEADGDSLRETALKEFTIYAATKDDMVPTQRLTGERLRQLGSFSVADAIRYFSGVQIKDYGGVGGLKTIDVRSMGTNHMGVFYDGIQLGNAQNGQVDLGRFSLDNVEEITLYNGQKSDLFQSARDYGSAGTVYIRTRRPQFAPGERMHLRGTFRTGSFGLWNPSMTWEQQWRHGITSSLSAEHVNATGRYRFRYRRVYENGTVAWDTTATRQNGDLASYRIEASLFGRTSGGGIWNAKAYYYQSERGVPGAIVNNVWKHYQRQWDSNFFTQGSFTQRMSPRYEMKVQWKYAYDYMRYLNPDTTLMYIHNKFHQHEVYLTTAHHITLTPSWEANVSADYQWNKLDANLYGFVYPHRHTSLLALSTSYKLWRFQAMGSLLGTWIKEGVRSGYKPSDEHRLTPAVFLTYRQHKALSMRAFYKRIFRMPTFNDLYYTDIGNIHLKPEYATQYNVGILYSKDLRKGWLRKAELKADAYYNKVENKIIAVPKGNGQYRWMMMNLGLVKIKGAELQAQSVWSPHPDWMFNLQAQYTFQRAQDRTDPSDRDPHGGTWGGQIAYIPRHSGSLTSSLSWKTWTLNYAFIYVGERYHNSSNIQANYEQPWYTSDLGMSYHLRWKGITWNAALECNNLLDQQYDVILNYPMPGRNWRFTLRLEY